VTTDLLAIGECMIELAGGDAGLYRQGYAGDTLNTAWHAKDAMGEAARIGYFTALGTDPFSERMLGFLAASGIDTAHVIRNPDRRPGLYMIEQKDGDRHFTYWRDRSAARLMAEDPAPVAAAVAEARMIYFSGITLAILSPGARTRLLDVLAAARGAGARLAFDPNIRPALWEDPDTMRAVLSRAAALSDIVLPSFDDEARWFGDADPHATARRYNSLGAAEIVVKDGGKPVLLSLSGNETTIPVPPVTDVVDATGAGDSFNGGYLAARLGDADPVAAAGAAIERSARTIRHHGAIPKRD